jgi:hypothetical protein
MRWGVFLFVALTLAGLVACVAYVALLDQFCPADPHATRKWVAIVSEVKATDVALVFFTYCLVLVTGWLVKATAALAAADRPHLLPGEFKISGLSGDVIDGKIRCPLHYRFTNSGKSPAFVKRWSLGVSADDLPARPSYPKATESNFIISPINGWYGSVGSSSVDLAQTEAARILQGEGRLIVYGYIEYPTPQKSVS